MNKRNISIMTIFILIMFLLTSNVFAVDVASVDINKEQPIMIIEFNQNGEVDRLTTTEDKPTLSQEECDKFVKSVNKDKKINISNNQSNSKMKITGTKVEFYGTVYVYRKSDRIKVTAQLFHHENPFGQVTYEGEVVVTGVNGDTKCEFSHELTLTNTIGKTKSYEKMLDPTSVVENVDLNGEMRSKKTRSGVYGKATVVNTAGGKYSTMKALEGERHHCPSTQALINTTIIPWTSGPAVRMTIDDHQQTANWGSAGAYERQIEENLIKQGCFLKAQQRGIDDVERKFPGKYTLGLYKMQYYTTSQLGFYQ